MRIAAATVTGITIIVLFVSFRTDPTAIAPNATCESPSPINENLLRTNVAPKSDEHKAIRIPTTRAYLTNGYCI